MFRATAVHQHVPYSNKTTTHVPSRLVTCAECRHTATPFVCPTIPRMKSNKCSSPWQPSYRSVLQFSLAPVLCSSFFGSYFRVVLLRKNPDLVRCFIWQPSQTQPRQQVRRLLSASFCSASVHGPHAWRPYYLMSEVSTEQCMLWSFYFRCLTVYYTRYELYILSAILYYTRYQG